LKMIALLTCCFDDEGGRDAYRHTTSHILAKLAIGPAIENGFYYDFDVEKPFSVEDLEKIEEEMKKIIKEDYKLERFTLPREEAIKFMEERNEPYKVELICRKVKQYLFTNRVILLMDHT